MAVYAAPSCGAVLHDRAVLDGRLRTVYAATVPAVGAPPPDGESVEDRSVPEPEDSAAALCIHARTSCTLDAPHGHGARDEDLRAAMVRAGSHEHCVSRERGACRVLDGGCGTEPVGEGPDSQAGGVLARGAADALYLFDIVVEGNNGAGILSDADDMSVYGASINNNAGEGISHEGNALTLDPGELLDMIEITGNQGYGVYSRAVDHEADLDISDTRISLLQGAAFAVPYILMSIPFGRLVDRFNRIAILVGGVIIWTIATFASGISYTYAQLTVARMFVGTGEASVAPASWSLLADYFPPEKLALPTSIFLMGPYIGGGLALQEGAFVKL